MLSRFPIEAGIAARLRGAGRQLGARPDRRGAAARAGARGRGRCAHWRRRRPSGDRNRRSRGSTICSDAALGNDRRKLDRFFAGLGEGIFEDAVWRAHGAAARRGDSAGDFCAALAQRDRARSARCASWLASGGKADDAERRRSWREFLALDFAPAASRCLRDWLLTKEGEPRKKLATKALADARPDLLAYLTRLQDALLRSAEDRQRAARAARLAEAALTVIAAVRHEYAAAKRPRGVLDYDDLIVKTLQLLEQRRRRAMGALQAGQRHRPYPDRRGPGHQPRAMGDRAQADRGILRRRRPRARPAAHHLRGGRRETIHLQLPGRRSRASSTSTASISSALAAQAEQPFVDQPLITSRRSAPEILRFVDKVFADAGGARRPDLARRRRSRIWPIAAKRQGRHRILDRAGAAPTPTTVDPYLPVDAAAARQSRRASGRSRWPDQIADWLDSGAAPAGP